MTAILFVTADSPSSYTAALRSHGYTVAEVSAPNEVRAAVGRQRYGMVVFEVPVDLDLFRYHYSFIASMLADTPRILLLDCRQKKLLDKSHPVFDLPLADYQLIQKPIARFDFVDRIHSICGCRATNGHRIAVSIAIEAFDGKARYEGVIRNLSSSGLRLSFPGREAIAKGDILHIRFILGFDGSEYGRGISAIAEVVWCLETRERRGIWPWRRPDTMAVGLEFAQINYDDKLEITRFVEGDSSDHGSSAEDESKAG